MTAHSRPFPILPPCRSLVLLMSSAASVESSTSYTTAAAAYAHALHSRIYRSQSMPAVTAIKRFPQISLTPEEQAHYDRVVGRLLYCAVQEYAKYSGTVDRTVWTPVRKNRHMAVYRDLRGTGNPRLTRLLGVGKIDGSLEDVMDGVYNDTSLDMRIGMAFLKSKATATAILQVSERRTPDDPFNFAGIKWWAAKTPGGPMSYDRDLLNYERMGMTFDANGDEVAYHLLQSIDRPEWPANTFKSLIRAHMSLCCLYKRKGNKVETFYWGEFYGSGNFPQPISDYGIAGRWLTGTNTVKCALAKKLSQLRELTNSRSSSASMTISDMYELPCKTIFATFAKSEGVCLAPKIYAEAVDRSGRPIKDRFCKKCLAFVAKQRGSKIHWNGVAAEQPPPYFDIVFQLSNMRSTVNSDVNSSLTTLLSDSNVIDTAYIDHTLSKKRQEWMDHSELDEGEWEDFYRRRLSHADRISRSSYSSEEHLLAELYRD